MTHPPSDNHESLCRGCGRCCYEKFIVDGHVFTTRNPCEFFDEATSSCKVYDRRQQANPRCLTVEQGIQFGVFPADCPYVTDLPDYLPAEEGWLDADVTAKIEDGQLYSWEDIRDEMDRRGGGEGDNIEYRTPNDE